MKLIKFREGFLLKQGWSYAEYNTNTETESSVIVVSCRGAFNDFAISCFHLSPRGGGARILPENVKIDISFDTFPSELIYGLWATLVGKNGMVVDTPFHFKGAYTHMPKDFSGKQNQLILTYLIIWNLTEALIYNYTKGLIHVEKIEL